MLPPVFVRANLAFGIDEHAMEFRNTRLSVFGVSGLRWDPLSPSKHFGREVSLSILTVTPDPINLLVHGRIMRETSLSSQFLGLRLRLESPEKEALADQVRRFGFYPTDYIRKYPRIPADSSIQTYPLKVIGRPFVDGNEDASFSENSPMVFDVVNLSPNGLLLSTENQLALSLMPGQKIDMIIEPRGWFPMQVAVLGLVCRILDEVNPGSKNLQRYVGVKFIEVDESNRAVFLDLLRDILEKIKAPRS